MSALLDFLKAGDPPHYMYVVGAVILSVEDLIARSPLKANSTVQLLFGALGALPGIGPVLKILGPKAAPVETQKETP